MTTPARDDELWADLVAAELALYKAQQALLHDASDLTTVLRKAIGRASHRRIGLNVLRLLPEGHSRELFPELVDQASVGHSDIGLVRVVILRMDRAWVIERIDAIALPLLERGNEEEYRRFAELYRELDPALFKRHLRRAAAHADPEVRDVVADYPGVELDE